MTDHPSDPLSTDPVLTGARIVEPPMPPAAEAPVADAPAPERAAAVAEDAQKRLDWRARRRQAAALRDASFDWLADGFTHQQIAAARKVSVEVVRRDIAKAIRARQAETREGHAQLQIARLTKGLAVVAHHIERGDISAVGPLVKVVTALDRYHGRDASAATAPREAPSEVPSLSAPPLALIHADPMTDAQAATGGDDGL